MTKKRSTKVDGSGGGASISQQLGRRRRNRILVLLAVVVLIVVARLAYKDQLLSGDSGDDYLNYNGRTFRCVRVVDGDTIDIDVYDRHGQPGRRGRTRIRMWGMDTPELARNDRGEMYFADQATDFATDLMLDKTVRLELVQGYTRGYYGRLLAYVYLPDGRMYNSLAIQQGYAYADHRFKHPKRQEFLDIERHARLGRRGLWAKVTKDDLPRWYPKRRLKGLSISKSTGGVPATMNVK